MSGVKGFVGLKVPPTTAESSLLHMLGSPWPDSSTYTSNPAPALRNAIPVGKLRPDLKTEILNPGGTTMPWPLPGSNCAVLLVQIGFESTAACAATGAIEARAPADT